MADDVCTAASNLVIPDLFQQTTNDHVKKAPGGKTSELSIIIQAILANIQHDLTQKVGPFKISDPLEALLTDRI